MRIVFIGPPGAGKGTQCQRLIQHLHIPHLSTGDMLRRARREDSQLGHLAHEYMSQGRLVPDPMILELVGRRLAEPDCASGALFDGFPRTVRQAQALDDYLAQMGMPLDVVLELVVSDDVVIQRLAGRGRNDDSPEVVLNRLKTFRDQTQPVINYYRQKGLHEAIDGLGSPDEVFARIEVVLARHRRPEA